MKIYAILLGLIALMAVALPVMAGKPATTCNTIQGGTLIDVNGNPISVGYDQWGYNYQAKMFNGWYDNYSRPTEPVMSGDSLMMKWNDAWLSNKDCTGDGKLDRHYGFASYKDSGAWLTNHATGTYETYDVTANYVLQFEYQGSLYNHDLMLSQDTNGNLTGSGGYPNGGPYSYTWDITTGSVVGDTISFDAIYTGGPDAVGTVMHVTGIINPDGSMTGDWDDNYLGGYREGTWSTTSGMVTTNMCTWSDFVKIVAVPSTAVLDSGYWFSADGVEIGPEIWGEFAIIQEVSDNPCGNDLGLMNYKSQLRSGLGNW